MMELQQKILDAFIGKVVRKDLAFLVKGGLPVPTYVLEYLLGQYCASDDEEIINDGLEKVKQVIRNNYVHRAEAESIKGVIREHGKHRVIDKVTVTLNERSDEYNASRECPSGRSMSARIPNCCRATACGALSPSAMCRAKRSRYVGRYRT